MFLITMIQHNVHNTIPFYSFITYRKSITSFPTGYRWSTYLPLSPSTGGSKTPLRNSSAVSAS